MWAADAHCDALSKRLADPAAPRAVTGETLFAGDVRLQLCALFSGTTAAPWQAVQAQLALWPAFCGELAPGCEAHLTVEDCACLEGSLERVSELAHAGACMMGLTWNGDNALGGGCRGAGGGLLPFGRTAVRRMGELRVAVDLAHACPALFFDAMDAAARPPCVSHACCRNLCGAPRNVSDGQIRALSECRGFLGVCFYPPFLRESGEATVSDVAAHIDHAVQTGGIGLVGLGSDFDGIEVWPRDLPDPSALPRLEAALRGLGYVQADIQRVFYGNLTDYLRRMRGSAR